MFGFLCAEFWLSLWWCSTYASFSICIVKLRAEFLNVWKVFLPYRQTSEYLHTRKCRQHITPGTQDHVSANSLCVCVYIYIYIYTHTDSHRHTYTCIHIQTYIHTCQQHTATGTRELIEFLELRRVFERFDANLDAARHQDCAEGGAGEHQASSEETHRDLGKPTNMHAHTDFCICA